MEQSTPKKKAGKPTAYPTGKMSLVSVPMTDEQRAFVAKIGDGAMAAGVRLLVDWMIAHPAELAWVLNDAEE